MSTIRRAAALALMVTASAVSGVAAAQTGAATPALDPARVAVASELIELLFPAATREKMIDGMMQPMLANIRQSMTQNPQFETLLNNDARAREVFERFLDRQLSRSTEAMHAGLPGMATAMTNAYARRFDHGQLRELKAFFSTPTGRVYMQRSMTIMSDPDVAAWQRDLMKQSMSHMQADVAELTKDIMAIAGDEKKP
jgi:hypothetical protein